MNKEKSQSRMQPKEITDTETEYEIKKSSLQGILSRSKTAYDRLVKSENEKMQAKQKIREYQHALEKVKEEKQQLADKVASYASELEVANAKKHNSKVNASEFQDLFKWDEDELNRKALEAFNSDEKWQKELKELRKSLGL
jgi:uncharacterized protein YukE